MQVIQTRDWPQEARDYLRQINRRPLVAVDDLPPVIKLHSPKVSRSLKTTGKAARLHVVLRVRKAVA